MRRLRQDELDALNAIYDRATLRASAKVVAALLREGLIARRGAGYAITPEGRLHLVPARRPLVRRG